MIWSILFSISTFEISIKVAIVCGKGSVNLLLWMEYLNKSRYGEMLKNLIPFYNQEAYTYYFDLFFEETVKSHNTRTKKMEFGEDSLRACPEFERLSWGAGRTTIH